MYVCVDEPIILNHQRIKESSEMVQRGAHIELRGGKK